MSFSDILKYSISNPFIYALLLTKSDREFRKKQSLKKFRLEGSEISTNYFEDGRFTMVMFDFDDPATVSFEFDEFEWTVVGEFDIQSCEQWEKANRRGF